MVPEKDRIPLPIGILTGPTATGKSSLAFRLASQNQKIEILSADSLLIYRGMDIGTAKPTLDELQKIPHHLINILDPNQIFTAGEFVRQSHKIFEEVHARGNRVLIVGGTGFYLKALLFGLWETPAADPIIRKDLQNYNNLDLFNRLKKIDEASAQRIGLSDRYRLIRALEIYYLTHQSPSQLQNLQPTQPNPQFRLWILDRSNSELHSRIKTRTEQMLQSGLIQEFRSLFKKFHESRALNAVGYAQVKAYLLGEKPPGRKVKPGEEGLSEEIQLATRQLVKQQRTWFRGQFQNSLQNADWLQWFHLNEDLSLLEETFKSVYG